MARKFAIGVYIGMADNQQGVSATPAIVAAVPGPNIINIDDLKRFADSFAQRVDRPEAKQWCCKNLRHFLSREPRLSRSIGQNEIRAIYGAQNKDPPDWIHHALDQNRTLHWFDPGGNEVWDGAGDFVQSLHNVVDWIRALPEDDRRWRQFHKIAVPEAIAGARAWHRSLAKRAAADWPEDWSGLSTVYRFDDGMKFVKLSSANSLEREGEMMGHCVAGYASAVASGISAIYSLRDTCNHPHVTIEIVAGHLRQLQGRASSFPTEKWRPYIRAFVRSMGWSVGSAHAARLGLFCFCGRTYTDVVQIVDDLPELPVLQDLLFDWRLLTPMLSFIRQTQSKVPNSAPGHQRSPLAVLRAGILAGARCYRIVPTERVAADLLLGSIVEVKLKIAGAAFALGEMGLFSETVPQITKLCRHIGRQVLECILKHPEQLYRLELVTGGPVKPGTLRRFFAVAGLALEFDQVRLIALEHKRKRALDAVVKLRHLLADRRKLQTLPAEVRAKAWNTMRVQVPVFCERTLLEPDVA
jgi:hypothetical protein